MFSGNTVKESRLSLLFVPSAEGGTKEIIMRNQMGKITGNIESIGTEDKSNNEGNITYDIMFRAGYPGKKDETIGLYINLEIQNSYYPGYPLEARAVYYAARRLSSELTKIDNHTNYGELQKVYSIWLCMGDDVPDKKAGTVSLYQLKKAI